MRTENDIQAGVEVGTSVRATTKDPHMVRAGKGTVEGTVFSIHNGLYLVRYGGENDWFQYWIGDLHIGTKVS